MFVPHQLSAACGEGNCVQFPVVVFAGEQGRAFCGLCAAYSSLNCASGREDEEFWGCFQWEHRLPVPCLGSGWHRTLGTNWKPNSCDHKNFSCVPLLSASFFLSFCLSLCCSLCKRDTGICLTGTNLRYKIISSMYKFFHQSAC